MKRGEQPLAAPSLGASMINLLGSYEYANEARFCFQGKEVVIVRWNMHVPASALKRLLCLYGYACSKKARI